MKNIKPPDQNLFKPEEEECKEPTKGKIIWRYVRVIIAFIIIVGLLYISGIYQSLFYHRTPASVSQPKVESRLDAEVITLPLQVFVFINDESGSKKSKEDVKRLVKNASKIWGQAEIELIVEKIVFLKASDEEIEVSLNNPWAFVANLQDYNDQGINVFLKETLRGLNGIAFIGLGVVTVADFTTSYDFRVLAHEIGHILNLEHVSSDKMRLMAQGAIGFNLTIKEIIQAREAVLNFNQ